jgi:hypothetical protein
MKKNNKKNLIKVKQNTGPKIKENKHEIKRRKTIIIIFIFAILVLIAFFSILFTSHTEKTPECTKDSDCVKMQISCCPCENGGQDACIPVSMIPLYQENLNSCSEKGKSDLCPGINNCQIQQCSCVDDECTKN